MVNEVVPSVQEILLSSRVIVTVAAALLVILDTVALNVPSPLLTHVPKVGEPYNAGLNELAVRLLYVPLPPQIVTVISYVAAGLTALHSPI